MNLSPTAVSAARLRARLLVAVAILLGLSDVALSFVILGRVRSHEKIRLVPGLQAEQILKPNEPSEMLLRNFAALYVATQENYTPATVRHVSDILLRWIAPAQYAVARKFLDGRAEESRQSQTSSSVILEDPARAPVERLDARTWKVILRGQKRMYLGDQFVAQRRMTYEVVLELGAPSAANPHALFIAGVTSALDKEDTK